MRAFLLQIAIYTVLAYESRFACKPFIECISSGRDREQWFDSVIFVYVQTLDRIRERKILPFATRIVRVERKDEFCCISKNLGFYGV
jgi:hypothetical protein